MKWRVVFVMLIMFALGLLIGGLEFGTLWGMSKVGLSMALYPLLVYLVIRGFRFLLSWPLDESQ